MKVLWRRLVNKKPFDFNRYIKTNVNVDFLHTKISTIYSESPLIIPMGHATNLIYFNRYAIITDPLFESPSILFKRYAPLVPSPEFLPDINAIVISHNHLDHLNIKSLKYLLKKNENITVHIPIGNKKLFKNLGFINIIEYTWWQDKKFTFNDISIKFTFLPAYHWSQRSLFDHNKSLWGSFMIELNNYSIYFAGDSAYSDHFKHIGSVYPKIDCGLMPIAPLEPAENIEETHMSIEESVKACIDLNLKSIIPIHWGVFRFGLEQMDDPIILFKKELEKYSLLNLLKTDKIGEICFLEKEINIKSIQKPSKSIDLFQNQP